MPMYRLTFIYNLAEQGWTETYYRFADSARLASSISFEHLQFWMVFRPNACKLVAIRAQEVDGLRRVYLRELGYQGVHDDPDVTSTAAVLQFDFAGTAGRKLWFRGLADSWVRRTSRGGDNPHPRFVQELRNLNHSIQQLRLHGRQIINANAWSHAFEFGPGDLPTLTRVRVRDNFEVAIGQYVYFGVGPVLGLQPERPYIVVDYTPGEIIIAHDWPPALGVQIPKKPVRVRLLEYDYPRLDRGEFLYFRKHSTGAAYRPMSWVPDGVQRTPLHPCGRIVDRGRTCYSTEMRFVRMDPGVKVPIRWYFVDEGRETIPFDHPFASRNWETQWDYPTFLGEVWERTHNSGRAPVELSGIGLCGTRDAWENGVGPAETIKPINPTTGQPCCCGPGVLNVSGGAAAGTRPPPVIVKGGGVAGGHAEANRTSLCPFMGELPIAFQFEIDGVINGGVCADCPDLNSPWIVTHTTSVPGLGCLWDSEQFEFCGDLRRWRLVFSELDDHAFVQLSFASTPTFILRYSKAASEWDAFGPNVLVRTITPLHCLGFPLTITVSPA